MTIGRKIGWSFGLILGILIINGLLSYWSILQLISTNYWLTHTHQVLEKLETLMSLMKDVEGGQRSFLLTDKNKDFLKPYDDALRDIKKTKDDLRQLVSDSKKQTTRLDELDELIAGRLKYARETLDAAESSKGLSAALDMVKTGEGKRMTDKVRAKVKEMELEEKDLLNKRQADADFSSTTGLTAIGLGKLTGILFVTIGGYYMVRSITTPVRAGVDQLASASAEILASTSEQAAGAQEQASSVSETVTTVDEVSKTADQASQRAKSVGEAVTRTMEIGKTGRKAVEDSLVAMDAVKLQIETTAENILTLAEQAQSIGDIIATVNDIAEQTNLLALNAAIEASRAGEHGKGFTVVASEVKALADQSKKATAQVRQILGEIQKATNTAVLSTEEVTKGVAGAIKVGSQAGETIRTLSDTLTDVARSATQIVASVGQQATGMAQIHLAMKSIDQVAKQNTVATRQAAQAAENLNKLGVQLAVLIGQ